MVIRSSHKGSWYGRGCGGKCKLVVNSLSWTDKDADTQNFDSLMGRPHSALRRKAVPQGCPGEGNLDAGVCT